MGCVGGRVGCVVRVPAMRIVVFEVSDQFFFGRSRIRDNPDLAVWDADWEDNWHVWCGCPL